MIEIIKIVVSLLPVFLFLITLILLDSYKLIKLKFVLRIIFIGSIVAVVCFLINVFILNLNIIQIVSYTRYVAPIIEEVFKSVYILLLIKKKKLGFMVDSAIAGFAIGSGFAFIENLYYLNTLDSSNILLWIVRGFGTAIMHGCTTAMFGIITINIYNQYSKKFFYLIPGLFIAIIIHSLYNHFFLSPVISTVVILILLPSLIVLIFNRSENYLRNWMELGLETDLYILESISSGNFSETKYGKYLQSLKDKFPQTVVADMLCFIQLQTELAIKAKGVLMMRESGFEPVIESEINEKFDELKYLERSIGITGKRAIIPLLHSETQDLWQLYFLEKKKR